MVSITQQHFDEVKDNLEKQLTAQRDYFERVLIEKDKALEKALASAKEAVQVAETNAEKWRASANEWRGAMNDRESKFALKEGTEKDIKILMSFKDTMSAKADQKDVAFYQFLSIAGFLFGLVGAVLKIFNL